MFLGHRRARCRCRRRSRSPRCWERGVVVDDAVADDRRAAVRRQLLGVERVRVDARPVLLERAVHDRDAGGVRARVAEHVRLGHDVGDERGARVALADVEAGVGVARAVAVVELAAGRVEGVQPVRAVVVRGHVAGPVAGEGEALAVVAGEEHAVRGVVPHGEVLDRDVVGEDLDAVLALELAVDDDLVAVEAADGQALGLDGDALVVHPRRDEHEVALLGGVDRGLDGRLVLGDGDRRSG